MRGKSVLDAGQTGFYKHQHTCCWFPCHTASPGWVTQTPNKGDAEHVTGPTDIAGSPPDPRTGPGALLGLVPRLPHPPPLGATHLLDQCQSCRLREVEALGEHRVAEGKVQAEVRSLSNIQAAKDLCQLRNALATGSSRTASKVLCTTTAAAAVAGQRQRQMP
jgi:hypothetical protein